MAFLFRLEMEDGSPADPPTLSAAVPNWSAGDVIALGAGRALRVVESETMRRIAHPCSSWRSNKGVARRPDRSCGVGEVPASSRIALRDRRDRPPPDRLR